MLTCKCVGVPNSLVFHKCGYLKTLLILACAHMETTQRPGEWTIAVALLTIYLWQLKTVQVNVLRALCYVRPNSIIQPHSK